MHVQELQDPKKVSAIWVENMNSLVNKMDKTKSSMIDIKPKDAIKQDIYIYQPGEQHGDQKTRNTDFAWIKDTY